LINLSFGHNIHIEFRQNPFTPAKKGCLRGQMCIKRTSEYAVKKVDYELERCFFKIKPTRCTICTIYFAIQLYMFRTVPLSIIRSLFTVHSAVVYVIQVWKEHSSRTRMELDFHPGPTRKLSTNVYDIYHCWLCSE
jgi:hypothetical protein